TLHLVTDGEKEGLEDHWVELGPGLQWVQIDLGQSQPIYAILCWHYTAGVQIYHDMVVQVCDDANFKTEVRTLFNNDWDNSSRLGKGADLEYMETPLGKLIDTRGPKCEGVKA